MEFRDITIKDYEKLVPFWKANYFVREMDEFERFKLFLEKNPKLSMLAKDGEKIVGSVLGSFDGRRGYLQKLVVDKDFRKKGIGQQLVERIIKKLQALEAIYIPIAVEKYNVAFYEKCGFNITSQVPMNIDI
jgi:ribosomal protein S18 acetylase RimI-like enzyme